MKIDLSRYVTFPSGYRPANPSIVRYGHRLLVCVRGVAYTLDKRLGIHGNHRQLPSLNRLFLLNNDLTAGHSVPLPQEQLDKIEDLKLFSGLGRVWGVGSLPVNDPPNANGCVVTLVEFDTGLTGCRLVRIASPFGFSLEKNWAPFFAEDALHFIYSYQPTLLVRYNPRAGSVALVDSRQHNRKTLKFLEGGSSGGLPTTSGVVFLTHRRVVRLPSRRRIYLSRIRRLSDDLGRLSAGPFFSIGRPTVQFANGLLLDEDRVLISYGEMDATATLAGFARERFERAVFPSA